MAAVPAPQLSEAAKASEDAPSSSSSGAEDDDGSVSVNLVKIARAPTDVNVKQESRYSRLSQRFEEEEGWTDAESVTEAALFPLEVAYQEDDKAGYGTPGDDDDAQVPDQAQELRQLLLQAEVASPTTRAKYRSYREEAEQVPRRSNLGFDEETDLDYASTATMESC